MSRTSAMQIRSDGLPSPGAARACLCWRRPAATSRRGRRRTWSGACTGSSPGWLHKPRVAAFDAQDHLYLADLTDRIQVFDRDGKYLRGWRTPEFNVDGPSGLTVDRYGRLLVADTHFYRVLVYSRERRAALPDRRRRAGDDARADSAIRPTS